MAGDRESLVAGGEGDEEGEGVVVVDGYHGSVAYDGLVGGVENAAAVEGGSYSRVAADVEGGNYSRVAADVDVDPIDRIGDVDVPIRLVVPTSPSDVALLYWHIV